MGYYQTPVLDADIDCSGFASQCWQSNKEAYG